MPISLVWGPPEPVAGTLTISNVVEDQLTDQSVRVSWDVSDFAQGWIEYGTTMGGPYPLETTHEVSFTYASHIQTISGLTESTAYYYRVVAVDSFGQTSYSTEGTFTTTGDIGPPPPDPGTVYTDYIIPSSIDQTGATDVSTAIQNFVNGVPSGSDSTHRSRIRPASASSVYQMSKGICLANKSYLDLDGLYYATINAHPTTYVITPMSNGAYSSNIIVGMNPTGFSPSACTDIRIYGWRLNGNGSAATPAFQGEWQCNIFGGLVDGLEIYDVIGDKARGDFFGGGGYGANNGYIHDVRNIRSERQFVTFDSSDGFLVEDFDAGIAAYWMADFEFGNGPGRVQRDITIRNGTFERWDTKTQVPGLGGFIALANQSFSGNTVENILIENITITGSHHATLQTSIGASAPMRLDGVTIRNCSATMSLPSGSSGNQTNWAFRARNVDGLTLTGNHQPGAQGPGSWYDPATSSPNNCTAVVGPPGNGNTV